MYRAQLINAIHRENYNRCQFTSFDRSDYYAKGDSEDPSDVETTTKLSTVSKTGNAEVDVALCDCCFYMQIHNRRDIKILRY